MRKNGKYIIFLSIKFAYERKILYLCSKIILKSVIKWM